MTRTACRTSRSSGCRSCGSSGGSACGAARRRACAPVVLVGLRTETREKSLFGEAAEEDGRAFADKLGCQGYSEVTPDGDVTDVFQAVVEAYMKNLKVESCTKTCVVM
jgi:hypothetical protein